MKAMVLSNETSSPFYFHHTAVPSLPAANVFKALAQAI
jgi:hypothetical protein